MKLRSRTISLAAAALCASCSTTTTTSPVVSEVVDVANPTPPLSRPEDNVLRIGLLLPKSGPGTTIGSSAIRGALTAVALINQSGGVLGHDVNLAEVDEGSDVGSANTGLKKLLDLEVDIIIGPASANIASSILPQIVASRTGVCSPIATSIALDDFPDNDLMMRTVASDALQAEAMAQRLEATGEDHVAVAYVDDAYGRPFASALRKALVRRTLTISNTIAFSPFDDDFTDEAKDTLAAGTGAVAVIGDPDAGVRMLAAIANQAVPGKERSIVVNDTLRRPTATQDIRAMPTKARTKIEGTAQLFSSRDRAFTEALAPGIQDVPVSTTLFAAQTYDCVNLAALAAIRGSTTDGAKLVAQATDISTGGTKCATFVDCKALMGLNFDYQGPDGNLAIDTNGNRSTAEFDTFVFDVAGRDVSKNEPFAVNLGSG